ARLAGVPFRRESGHGKLLALGHARARHCGNFSLDQEQRWVEVYDCAFDADRYAFVGPLDQPLAPSVRIVLHEIAHALSGAQLGDLLVDVATSQREAQQMVDEFNQLGAHVPRDEVPRVQQLQDGIQKLQGDLGRWQQKLEKADQGGTPVVRAFLRLPGASSGFTSYGRTNAAEAFAEAFSLCRTDPEAGRRISAQVCAFFESDAYLEPAS
ncbi:MAG TPA: hypothetical protein VEI82_10730, partial [Myxococcota bacterium]|nr:hypothetical protein [Myxococcota bacterium]